VESSGLLDASGGSVNVTSTLGKWLSVSDESQHDLVCSPVKLPGVFPRGSKAGVHTVTCAHMSTMALFAAVPKEGQLRCPLTGDCIKKHGDVKRQCPPQARERRNCWHV
jgi:hypothetical protein